MRYQTFTSTIHYNNYQDNNSKSSIDHLNYHELHHYYHRSTSPTNNHHNQNALQRLLHHGRPRQSPPRLPQRRLPRHLLSGLLNFYPQHFAYLFHRLRHACPALRPQHHQGVEGHQEAPQGDERGLRRLLRPGLRLFYPCFFARQLCGTITKGQLRGPARAGACAAQLREGVEGDQDTRG
jgi:hypothetical protein